MWIFLACPEHFVSFFSPCLVENKLNWIVFSVIDQSLDMILRYEERQILSKGSHLLCIAISQSECSYLLYLMQGSSTIFVYYVNLVTIWIVVDYNR